MQPVSQGTPNDRREVTRAGGARADFLSQLGRRVGELRSTLAQLEQEPHSPRARDDLRRRLHALSTAARILRFHAMADELAIADALLAQYAGEVAIPSETIASLQQSVSALSQLAWGDAADTTETVAPPRVDTAPPRLAQPATALVVGGSWLASALAATSDRDALDHERVDDTSVALDMARALAPDVVLLDADLQGSDSLATRLADDPLTEPVPLVVVGSFPLPEHAARWVALGASRVVPKPASPTLVYEACTQAIEHAQRPPRPEPIGTLTVDQLGDRLAEELKRGLCDAVASSARAFPIPFGEGHDVLAALWSSLARLRELATIRSSGVIRFAPHGPDGAVPVGSFGDARSRDARVGDSLPPERLEGRVILVADDDPSVTWFLAGVLRAAGALVLEAHDGEAALSLAYRAAPELVISDVLMPRLDGFSLCRALKRDVALRDVPVILLSWKEDLLQRVRELGASADGYLRKEASAQVVLSRVREVLRPRLRIESRLADHGPVHGRLDGLTVRTLLSLARKHRPASRLSIRDASFLYEIELRDGAVASATRTSMTGAFERGTPVLAASLGIGAGRFTIAETTAPIRSPLPGTLDEQTRPLIARARAAQKLLSGPSLLDARSIDVDLDALDPYLGATPDNARDLLDKLAAGVDPRALVMRGGIAARLLEDLLADAAARGAIARIVGRDGDELLDRETRHELDVLTRDERASLLASPPTALDVAPHITPSPIAVLPMPGDPSPVQTIAQAFAPSPAEPSAPHDEPAPDPADVPWPTLFSSFSSTIDLSPLAPAASPEADPQLAAPFPPPSRPAEPPAPPQAAPPQAAPPQAAPEPPAAALAPQPSPAPLPSLAPLPPLEPPPAPEPPAASEAPVTLVAAPAPPADVSPSASPLLPQAEACDAAADQAPDLPPFDLAPDSSEPELPAPTSEDFVCINMHTSEPAAAPPAPERAPSDPPPVSAPAKSAPPPPRRSQRSGWLVAASVLVATAASALYVSRDPAPTARFHALRLDDASPAQEGPASPPPAQPGQPVQQLASLPDPDDNQSSLGIEDLPLVEGDDVPDGKGLLEVVSNRRDDIVVDKLDAGKGPRLRVALAPGVHDVRSRRKGDEQPLLVTVRPGRRTRVDLRGPWRR